MNNNDENKEFSYQDIIDKEIKVKNENKRIAHRIATMYLSRAERLTTYGITMKSYDGSEDTYYVQLTPKQLNIFDQCQRIADEQKEILQNVMLNQGLNGLLKDIIPIEATYWHDYLDSIDLSNPIKLCRLTCYEWQGKNRPMDVQKATIRMNDQDYCDLLEILLINKNEYSMNALMCDRPDLAAKIIDTLTEDIWDPSFVNENPYLDKKNPFFINLSEHKHVVKSILDPYEDSLGLFHSEDSELKNFAIRHQIVPSSFNLFHKETHQSGSCFKESITCSFHETKLTFEKRYGTLARECETKKESFDVDAQTLMQKFSVSTPLALKHYLQEHYNNENAFELLAEEFRKSE